MNMLVCSVWVAVPLVVLTVWLATRCAGRRRRQLAALTAALRGDASVPTLTCSQVRAVLGAAPDAMVAINATGEIAIANPRMEALFGHAADAMVGRSLDMLLPARVRITHAAHVRRYVQQPHAREMGHGFELVALHRDGREFPAEISISPLRTVDGLLVVSAIRDLTPHRAQEAQLVAAREAALAAVRARTDFLARMSHDLRMPMQAVIGAIELLRRTPLDAVQAPYVTLASTAADSLVAMTHDLLDLARIETGRLRLCAVPFNLSLHVRRIADLMALEAAARALEFTVDLAPDLPARVLGDPHRLTRILANLLSNAIKFTERGGVGLRLRRAMPPAGEGHVWFTVEDSGIGIASDDIERVFECYEQGPASAREAPGAGLGLAITRELVRLMGGRIWVDSQVGRGSMFHITIPLEQAPLAPELERPGEGARRPLKVLVAEDTPECREVLGGYLACCAGEVAFVDNGGDAVARLAREGFEVVLMDLNLSGGLAGDDAIRAIRAAEAAREVAPCFILSLTADARAEARVRSLTAGADAHLVKPLRLADLVEALGALAPAVAGSSRVEASAQYLTRRREDLVRLRACLVAGDYAAVGAIGHRLRGHAASYGFAELGDVGVALERAAESADAAQLTVLEGRLAGLLDDYSRNR